MMEWTYVGFVVAGVAAGLLTARLSQLHYEATASVVRNPGFEDGTTHWGSGYLEDRVRNGNFSVEVEQLPYVVSPDPQQTLSRGYHDPTVGHNSQSSYRLEHRSPEAPAHFGSIAQRVSRLVKNRRYAVSFWTKAASGAAGEAFFVTTNYPWTNRTFVPPTAEWTQQWHFFNSGDLDYADIRFVIQSPGTFWLDDVDVREAP
jgi:hypothetical protein